MSEIVNPLIKISELPHSIITRIGEVLSYSYPKQGCTSSVMIVESNKGRFVVKRSEGERFRKWLHLEYRNLLAMNTTDLLIPHVYCFLDTHNETWLLMSCVAGETIRTVFEKNDYLFDRHEKLYNIGQSLAHLHNTICPNELYTTNYWLEFQLRQAEHNLHHYRVNGTAELLNNLKQEKPDKIKQTLIHGDCSIDNILIAHNKVSGFIDWGFGAFGDPRFDISLLLRPRKNIFQQEIDIIVFFEGYGGTPITKKDSEYFVNLFRFL